MHINGGDYLTVQNENTPFAVDFDITAAALGATTKKAVRSADWQIYVQRIVFSHATHVVSKVFSVQDDAGTPVVIAAFADLAAAAGVPDARVWDFGPKGTPLTIGQNLQVLANTGGTGFAGRLHIEGYQRLGNVISTLTPNTGN